MQLATSILTFTFGKFKENCIYARFDWTWMKERLIQLTKSSRTINLKKNNRHKVLTSFNFISAH